MIRFASSLAAWLFALFAFAAMVGTAAARAENGEALGPGDSIRISVFGNPDLTTEARVGARGTVRMPLVGDVDVGGVGPTEAATRIANRLQRGQFLKDPQVTVNVLQVRSRQVSVLGEVLHPGRYVLEDHARVTDALALAGGITPAGNTIVSIMSTRNNSSVKQTVNIAKVYRNADASANIELKNGDTVYVEKAPVFYIYGQIQHAGAYRLDAEIDVMRAISLGGGLTTRGTERGLTIRRRMPNGGVEEVKAQLTDHLRPDDVVYVQESFF